MSKQTVNHHPAVLESDSQIPQKNICLRCGGPTHDGSDYHRRTTDCIEYLGGKLALLHRLLINVGRRKAWE